MIVNASSNRSTRWSNGIPKARNSVSFHPAPSPRMSRPPLISSMVAWGADAVGGNCGNGPDELVPVIERMRAVDPDAVLVAKSNAGMPELVDMRAVYRADPPSMAAYGVQLHEAGARIVGACCGSSPDHLRAMHAALAPAAS